MSWIPGISAISDWFTTESKDASTPTKSKLNDAIKEPVVSPQNPVSHTNSLASIDPTGFERAAIAIKEINKSPHASKILQVTTEQEKTRRKELELQQEQLRLALMHEKSQLFQKDQEAKKESKLQEIEHQQKLSQYRDQLERQRYSDQLIQQQQLHSEILKSQEESSLRQETLRKSTLDYDNNLKLNSDLNKIKAEAFAKGEVERKNQDLTLDQIKLREEENRKTILQSIGEINSHVASGITNVLSDTSKLGFLIGGISFLAFGIYAAKNITLFAKSYLESIIGKPKLVRETSRISLMNPFVAMNQLKKRFLARPQFVMEGIFFNPMLASRLQDIAIATYYTKINKGNYRNLYLFGPPGTGKTLYAKSLAWNSGMDYALLTGGDIVPLGISAVTELHKLFNWANRSRKGVLIFVDEADAFMKNRSKEGMSENLRSALNAFLYLTGETSRRYMLVLSSNQPHQFDSAILDRIDDIIEVGLPSHHERVKILKFYFIKILYSKIRSNKFGWGKISLPEIDYDQKFQEISDKLGQFSGREITKLVNSWQAKAYSSENRSLSELDMDEGIRIMLQQHKQKFNWSH